MAIIFNCPSFPSPRNNLAGNGPSLRNSQLRHCIYIYIYVVGRIRIQANFKFAQAKLGYYFNELQNLKKNTFYEKRRRSRMIFRVRADVRVWMTVRGILSERKVNYRVKAHSYSSFHSHGDHLHPHSHPHSPHYCLGPCLPPRSSVTVLCSS